MLAKKEEKARLRRLGVTANDDGRRDAAKGVVLASGDEGDQLRRLVDAFNGASQECQAIILHYAEDMSAKNPARSKVGAGLGWLSLVDSGGGGVAG